MILLVALCLLLCNNLGSLEEPREIKGVYGVRNMGREKYGGYPKIPEVQKESRGNYDEENYDDSKTSEEYYYDDSKISEENSDDSKISEGKEYYKPEFRKEDYDLEEYKSSDAYEEEYSASFSSKEFDKICKPVDKLIDFCYLDPSFQSTSEPFWSRFLVQHSNMPNISTYDQVIGAANDTGIKDLLNSRCDPALPTFLCSVFAPPCPQV